MKKMLVLALLLTSAFSIASQDPCSSFFAKPAYYQVYEGEKFLAYDRLIKALPDQVEMFAERPDRTKEGEVWFHRTGTFHSQDSVCVLSEWHQPGHIWYLKRVSEEVIELHQSINFDNFFLTYKFLKSVKL